MPLTDVKLRALQPTEKPFKTSDAGGLHVLVKGPRYKRFGSRILYPIDGVEEWERDQEHQSTSEYSTRAQKATGKAPKGTPAESPAAKKRREASERLTAEMGEFGREIERLIARRDELAAQAERPRRRRAG